jgi:UDP-N-acetylmuramoyl-tripeptide--D-alanyl-D-alanine ligase
MSWLMLSEVAAMLDAEMVGPDVALTKVSTDTREDVASALFFALQGPNFDAHQVLDKETALPLAGLVVARKVAHPASYIVVDDTRMALGKLAAAWRQRCKALVIGLTGSNGKTTVKEMLANICTEKGATLATAGNLNNDIGVPLTLLRLRPEHAYAVIEMGANHPGEIRYLSDLAKPDVALLLNATAAHLEGFGSVDAVADAKGEIFSSLDQDGIAVINVDSPFASRWKALNLQRSVVTFGIGEAADSRVVRITPLLLALAGELLDIELDLPGRHNALNAAAAAAAAHAAGVESAAIVRGLEATSAVAGRLAQMTGLQGAVLIDDSYNANPASLQAAIEVLAARSGKRYLVLGDMAELGGDAAALHAGIGRAASEAGIEGLLALGALSARATEAFGRGGEWFASIDELLDRLLQLVARDVTLLVKGSRSAGMERVVRAMQADTANGSEETHHAA